ncbi:unnamed protein product, partial [Ectocarpus sp. 12 AP-2014]
LAGNQVVRLQGEQATAEFVMLLPPDARSDQLVLTLQNSAYVLPERSFVDVFVNGFPLGSRPLEQIAGPGELRFDLPLDMPLDARSVVRVEVTQTHRMHCGSDAVYDLWTDIHMGVS